MRFTPELGRRLGSKRAAALAALPPDLRRRALTGQPLTEDEVIRCMEAALGPEGLDRLVEVSHRWMAEHPGREPTLAEREEQWREVLGMGPTAPLALTGAGPRFMDGEWRREIMA